MSGGEKKKRASKAHGWEEAKDEFYQESYPTDMMDFEALERDPRKITTLLPSQQNRATTYNRKMHQKDGKNKSTIKRTSTRSNYMTTVRRQSVVQDNYVAMMPDLSENLSNEMTTWEEIMKIKDMPISMAQKKEQKAKLQSATKLRLQGYEQFKWQKRKMFQQIKSQWKETYSKLELWQYSFKQIEGQYGTGVVTYFKFIKWLMFLNLVIFLLMFLFVVLPTLISDVSEDLFNSKIEDIATCREQNSMVDVCSGNYTNSTKTTQVDALDVLQGTGIMEITYLFYGKYDCSIYMIPYPLYYYNLPLAYVLVTICAFILSLVAIVKSAAQGFKDRLLEGEGQFYQYCNLVFGGWDFCIQNEKSANMKHKALYNEIKSHLIEERRKEEKMQRSGQIKTKLIFVRTFVNVIVLLVLGGSGTLIYFTIDYQTKFLNDATEPIVKLLLQYLPSIAIIGLNTIVPLIFNYLVAYEHYSPMFVIKMSLLRTIFLRLASLVVLLASIYSLISCKTLPNQCASEECKTPLCWETYAGQQIYRLILLDFVAHVLITFFLNFPRMLIAKHFKSRLAKKIGDQEFELPKHVLDIVYSQALCWLGMYFAPLLPGLTTIELFFMFYVKKFACLVNSNPASTVHLASRSKSLFMTILLLSFVVAVTPVGLSIADIRPSISCGPFRGEDTVWVVVVRAFQTLPNAFKSIIFYFATAGFAVPAFIVLTLSLYYFFAVSQANKHMVAVLKNQLVLEGHDKQFLLNRLSAFIKQQQEHNRKQARNVAASGDVNSITDNSASQSVH